MHFQWLDRSQNVVEDVSWIIFHFFKNLFPVSMIVVFIVVFCCCCCFCYCYYFFKSLFFHTCSILPLIFVRPYFVVILVHFTVSLFPCFCVFPLSVYMYLLFLYTFAKISLTKIPQDQIIFPDEAVFEKVFRIIWDFCNADLPPPKNLIFKS